ncbi:hypothetical protein QNM99_00500 [Pseudomonas sp. PCH446]
MKNLEAFPCTASAQVRYKGQPAPAWMTYDALRAAVSDADIGRTYPDLLRQKLQHDLAERTRQKGFFPTTCGCCCRCWRWSCGSTSN